MDFGREIRPILVKNCLACHGATKQRGGLRLDRRAGAMAGGDSGHAFEPGQGGESLLIEYVSGADPDRVMPPKGDRLTAAEVERLRAWIDQGASWPDDHATLEPASSDPAREHWAFLPIVRPAMPEVSDHAWIRNPIDAFILERLEAERVRPSAEASRPTLLRRLSLDLTGLPPTIDEVDAFVDDPSPDAYERAVDRLLASPRYGERWGRHWLDLARYADSDGYEKDSPRPNAWRYRHWVIDALNRDLPFDRFTIEQIAGDLLPDADLATRTATGFHRNTLTNREGGVDKEEFRVAATVDRVNTTGTVWLGLTVGCAQCHTHKYDPILHKDYYGLFAFFNPAQEVDLPTPSAEDEAAYPRAKAAFEAEQEALKQALARDEKEHRPARQTAWEASLATTTGAGPDKDLPGAIAAILAIPGPERTPDQDAAIAAHHRSIDPTTVKLARQMTAHARKVPALTTSKVMMLAANPRPPKTHILIRGDFLRPGDEVEPATPAVLPPLKSATEPPDRLDLARWLTDPSNPLPARVTVNRIWRQVFGRGIVPSVDDFGTRGELPTHPRLLDWLAAEFTGQGWSQKQVLRTIVLSSTYRQSSRARPELHERDPNNLWLARQNRLRLEAEILRDVTLATSGLLAPRIGGPSVRPPQPDGIAELTYAGSAKWVESQGADRYRRGMYTWHQRTSPYPMLMTFDMPDSNVCAVKRERSNTPLQALTLLNDTTFFECARALGRRIVDESCGDDDGRLRYAFRVCLARVPSDEESSILSRLHRSMAEHCRANPEAAARLAGPGAASDVDVAAWVAMARTILNLDEFVTRE